MEAAYPSTIIKAHNQNLQSINRKLSECNSLNVSKNSSTSSLPEEDVTQFRGAVSFALESPPSMRKSVSKSFSASDRHSRKSPLQDQHTQIMLSPPPAPCPPSQQCISIKSTASCNNCNGLNSCAHRRNALPSYPPTNPQEKCLRFPPTTTLSYQASHRCSDQSSRDPLLPCPCLLSAAMEKYFGYTKSCSLYMGTLWPTPNINPVIQRFVQPVPGLGKSSSALAQLQPYNEKKNIMGTIYNSPFNSYLSGPIPPLVPMNPTMVSSGPSTSNINSNDHNLGNGFGGPCANSQKHSSFQPYKLDEWNKNSRESIELLEKELQELLRGRRKPVRISVLSAMYEEKFHKPFNRAHENLRALLFKCRNIVLVYRPGGQHVIMLKHGESKPAARVSRRSGRSLDPRSRKIYLTFPPGSTFTSEDAEVYFSRQFGPVRGVRMSHEEPPTYAFVEFYSSEGALSALCNTKAHYILAQKVMVKPYKQSCSYK